jgi:parallel beta-helix repeat protein
MLILCLTGVLVLTLRIQPTVANGTIYIRADGSIDPFTASIQRNGDVYVFTSDILNASIVVEKDNITLNGNGHLLQFFGSPDYGVYLYGRKYLTVTKIVVEGFDTGIYLEHSSQNYIINNTMVGSTEYGMALYSSDYNHLTENEIVRTGDAVYLRYSSGNILSDNVASGNNWGIFLDQGHNNILRNNVMIDNAYPFCVGFDQLDHYIQDIDTSNTVEGKPVYYWINRHDMTVPSDAGCAVIVNSTRITVKNLAFRRNFGSVTLAFTTYSSITNLTLIDNGEGINLDHSNHNMITNNKAVNSFFAGIFLDRSDSNSISNNTVTNTTGCGIWLEDTYSNTVTGNNVTYTFAGCGPQEWDGSAILVDDSSSCNIIGNNLTENEYGILVGGVALDDTVAENTIAKSLRNVVLYETQNCTIYNNNFLEPQKQQIWAYDAETVYRLGNGYRSGGNYWSDYTGYDQNGDGVGDTPYCVDQNHQDLYPLMSPYGSPPLPTYLLTIAATDNGRTSPSPGTYRHSQGQKIPVNATPSTGYLLDHWELDDVNVGALNPMSIMMTSSPSLRAVFAVVTYNVTVKAHCNPEGADVYVSLTMDGSPTGYTTPHTFMGLTGTHTFTVPRYDVSDHTFKEWDTGQSTTTITATLGATFIALYDAEYSLAITSTAGGCTNPLPDTYNYWSGSSLSIMAVPENGYYLDFWLFDGVNAGAPNPTGVKMDGNHALQAVFAQFSAGHDVAVKYVFTKGVVGQGFTSTVYVTAMNVGDHAETFNVTAHAGTTAIALQTVTLAKWNSTIAAFVWNTTALAKGNYSISAYAEPVADETATSDNNFTRGWVIIATIGDITGPSGYPDGKVDARDVAGIASRYGVKITDPRYDMNWDLTGPTLGLADGKIDARDVALVSSRYGWHK